MTLGLLFPSRAYGTHIRLVYDLWYYVDLLRSLVLTIWNTEYHAPNPLFLR